MHILWLDPFHGGSHATVTTGYASHSRHHISILSLPIAGGWRWRMRGGAVTLARMAQDLPQRPDLIVASDMLDMATFRALTNNQFSGIPTAVYFHENQLTYPLPAGRSRDLSFAWINYTTALVADAVIFNSDFHRRTFLAALPDLLGRYHDYQELATIAQIAAKSQVLPPGIDLDRLDGPRHSEAGPAVILWNSRWEYDKQPEAFFRALEEVAQHGADFRLIIAGEHIDPQAPTFAAARNHWATRSIHWGYAPNHATYAQLLRRADIVVSTAIQEFFGIAIVEAMFCGCAPILPQRLNYPHLLPPHLHAEHLYHDHSAMVKLLCAALTRPNNDQHTWRELATPYGWANLAPRYDALLEAIAQR